MNAFQKIEDGIRKRFKRIGKGKYSRVLKVARKPGEEEYFKMVKIGILGVIVLGGIGFLISWLMNRLPIHINEWLQ